jgi:uncharacterized RDD family membrane protein YckC
VTRHPLWRRACAYVTDNLITGVLALAIAAVPDTSHPGAVWLTAFVVLDVLKLIVLQGLTGWTPGKWLFGIRVVNSQGEPPGIVAAIKRTIPLLFEWTAFIGLVAIYTSPRGQRFGDRWAHTYVVRSPRTQQRQAVAA